MTCKECFYYEACEHFAQGDAVECTEKHVEEKCPIFLKMVCETCAYNRKENGRRVCGHVLHRETDARQCFYCSDWLKKG